MKYNNRNYVTDREKRLELDKKIKQTHPEYSDEQVKEKRELYLQKKYSSFLQRLFPLPEQRTYKEKYGELTKEKILNGKTKPLWRRIDDKATSILVFVLFFGFPMFIAYIFFIAERKLPFIIMVIALLFGCGYRIYKYIENRNNKDKTIKFRVKLFIIENMARESIDVGADETYVEHYLFLERFGKRIMYVCRADEYRRVREGDIVYAVFVGDNKAPFFAFREEDWDLNGEMQEYVEKAKSEYYRKNDKKSRS